MGIEKEHFVIFGIKDEYSTFASNDLVDEDDCNNWKHIVKATYNVREYRINHDWKKIVPICINDGMSGEYSIFGILISANGQDRWGDDRDLNDFISLSDMQLLQEEFETLCQINKIQVSDYKDKIGLYTFTHYT